MKDGFWGRHPVQGGMRTSLGGSPCPCHAMASTLPAASNCFSERAGTKRPLLSAMGSPQLDSQRTRLGGLGTRGECCQGLLGSQGEDTLSSPPAKAELRLLAEPCPLRHSSPQPALTPGAPRLPSKLLPQSSRNLSFRPSITHLLL